MRTGCLLPHVLLTSVGLYIDDAAPLANWWSKWAYSTRKQGPKTGAAWKKTSWRSIWQDGARGVVAATPTNRQWQGDRNVWPTTRAPGKGMQRPKGGEVRCMPDVANDEGDHRLRLAPLVKRLFQAR